MVEAAMSDFRVRQAEPRDAAAYIRLIKGILREQPPVDTPYDRSEFDPAPEAMAARIAAYPATGNSLFLVAAAAEATPLIGVLTCAGGTLKADRHVTELGIYVEKGWRGRGVGTALLTDAIRWARAHPSIERVALDVMTTNHTAIGLYEHFGFEREGVRRRAYKRGGYSVDMLVMALVMVKGAERTQ
jgi:RimJ/RimL family protein N-acetyltransferase